MGIKKITGIAIGVAAAWAVAAPSAFGGVGSVISSFYLGSLWGLNYCISRDSSYVYVIRDYQEGGGSVLFHFKPNGEFANSSPIEPHHSDADHSVLGPGYIAAIQWYGSSSVRDYSVYTGSAVATWVPFDRIGAYAHIPGGRYKYVISGDYFNYGYLYRFTTDGSLVSSFSVGPRTGALAATDTLAGRSGEYLIVAKGPLMTAYSTSGSVVASYVHFQSPTSNYGCVCGPGYPAEYGTTLWYIQSVWYEMYSCYVFQAYLGNGVAVAPASVGKIKALYR